MVVKRESGTTTEANVSAYRVYLLDAAGRVLDTRDIACDNDHDAEEQAARILEDQPQIHTVEIWVRPRLVSRLSHESEPLAARRP